MDEKIDAMLWHILDNAQILHKIFRATKQRAVLPNSLQQYAVGIVFETVIGACKIVVDAEALALSC